jgi:hypothetical protein
MRRTRQVLAVMVVTTALCADRAASAAPVVFGGATTRSHAAGGRQTLAGRLVTRLSQTFRQVVPSAAPLQARQVTLAVTLAPRALADQSLGVPSFPISPFQFRLPPPTA